MKYDNPKFQKFVDEVAAAGFADSLRHYDGRNFYSGPAVVVDWDDVNKIIRATTADLSRDSMGKTDVVLYPA